jgi:hypothetical protein
VRERLVPLGQFSKQIMTPIFPAIASSARTGLLVITTAAQNRNTRFSNVKEQFALQLPYDYLIFLYLIPAQDIPIFWGI